jgi:flagellar protein FliO/FliZ
MVSNVASILTAAVALAAVIALIWLVGRAARFSGMTQRTSHGRLLAVQDVIALDTRRRLHVVKCGEKRVLLLTGGAQDVVVGWIEHEEPAS